ncbi:BURP domain-containing protein BNM2A-like [Punica granatum]|uniref:BURP domain-containing protein n=2 Tax=Punica granatum TaxID=22663 RepID=A0A218XW29_PUNGR|nr:BURP domain-containing protein BNM2A-like [Punica granatum]OWM89183.1 hypothetical protein CDL15_Pgr010469 [Punica granatum]PKI33190.1 hypothetical protein CRG98_046411 [Punica granatum]
MAAMRFESWTTILIPLLLLQVRIHGGSGARELDLRDPTRPEHPYPGNTKLSKGDVNPDVLRLPSEHGHHGMMHHHHRHGAQGDPSTMVFFTLTDLKEGNALPVYFPKRDPLASPKFLPREEAESIPFSSARLPTLLELFNFPRDSAQASAMEDTLRQCEAQPIVGEIKICATSLESQLDFVRSIFDSAPAGPSKFAALSTSHLAGSSHTASFQNYTISGPPLEVAAPTMVACHTMPYPYAVFYCHSQKSPNRVFQVPLLGENGEAVQALAVCHLDTSQWSPEHVSFRVLGIEPGSSHVCHFFPADHLVWVPAN